MTLLNTINVGGTDFGFLNNTVIGVCNTPAGSEVKECTLADSFELKAGVVVTITFTYANTYGDGSTTYPKLSVNGASYPIKYATNAYAGAGAWINGQTVPFMFDGTGFILVANLMQTSVISSANTTVNGAPLYNGANVKVMFTSALAGADTSTALVLNYNGSNITVKVPVNGALADYVAKAVDESGTTAYYFCQAYTTLELLFDGTYFVITNNPVVISNSDYVINADGSIAYTSIKSFEEDMVPIQFGTDDTTCYPLFSLPANTYVQGYMYANLSAGRLVDTLVIKDVQDGRVDINIAGISIKQTYDYEYVMLPFCYKSGNSAVTIYAEIYGLSGSVNFKVRRAIFN